jgi:peptidoglycan hydrolase CwlO-like protein
MTTPTLDNLTKAELITKILDERKSAFKDFEKHEADLAYAHRALQKRRETVRGLIKENRRIRKVETELAATQRDLATAHRGLQRKRDMLDALQGDCNEWMQRALKNRTEIEALKDKVPQWMQRLIAKESA